MIPGVVNNKFRVIDRIGGGSFGEIYKGVGVKNEMVAIKFEKGDAKSLQLRHEYKVYRELANCTGFGSVYFFGVQDGFNVMAMELLGPSLEDLFNECGRRFTLRTVLQLADQLLECMDVLHSRHLIHRDVKPSNFVMGLGPNSNRVYCVDFGLSKRFRDPRTMVHSEYHNYSSLAGTPRYASINNHLGIKQSRRDDIESVAYILIYFLKGSLPWQGLKAKTSQKKYKMILDMKQQVPIVQLCSGLPAEFAELLAYSRTLAFDEKPDIIYFRRAFRNLYRGLGLGAGFDWVNPPLRAPNAAIDDRPATAASETAATSEKEVSDKVQEVEEDPPSCIKKRSAPSNALPAAPGKQAAIHAGHASADLGGPSHVAPPLPPAGLHEGKPGTREKR